jgi:hypothetical protein
MTKKSRLDAFWDSLTAELEDDHVGLWSVVKQVQRAFPDSDPEAVRNKALALILFLLETGSAEAGFPTEDGRGFRAWRAQPLDVVRRIASEWSPSNPPPTVGEIVWFTAPREAVSSAPTVPWQGEGF